MKKHLKYIDGNSDKFWQIEASDLKYTVTYGKNGTLGTSQTKTFESATECLKNAEKILAEKIKKGYSENGDVIIADKIDPKTGIKSNISEILDEYDFIIKQKDQTLILPFLIKNAKGNLEPIRKHIKKSKRYWMTFIDLTLEPGYKKQKNNWNWGIRADEKISEIITLTAIATFDKTDILTIDQTLQILEKAHEPRILEILTWAKPNWVDFYLLDRFKKSEWLNFSYKSLRFLEEKDFISYNPELLTLCISRYNSWHDKKPRDFIEFISTDEKAYKRDVKEIFNYETNIQNCGFRDYEIEKYDEHNVWSIVFNRLLSENKLEKKEFIENVILIQTKDWNNNLKLFFRKILEDLKLSPDELIPFQENIFTFFHNSNPTIVNYGSDLIKKIFDHQKFKTKIYFEWLEALLMRNDCKLAIKNSLIVLEKISKSNSKLNKAIAILVGDVFMISDLTLQERTAKFILKIGSDKDDLLKNKLSQYASNMQGSVKTSLNDFLNQEDLILNKSLLETYQFQPKQVKLLVDEVEIPKNWNEILFLFGRFISSDEIIESETLLNVYINQQHLFPEDYKEQLQPYRKQLEKSYFNSVLKNYIKNLIINRVSNKNQIFKIDDSKYKTLSTLRLIKPIIEKVFEKNKENSLLPLLSFPTHKPHWIEPKILIERLISYQINNEKINLVDLNIAISRMPRENIDQAVPLLEKLDSEMKQLMAYCLGVSNEININSSSKISRLFHKVSGLNLISNDDKLYSYAVAARTFYPNDTFIAFDNTGINNLPFVSKPFIPKIEIKDKWNEWKNHKTKEIERSPTWRELNFELPEKKSIPDQLLYSLDLNIKKEEYTWSTDYSLNSVDNLKYWNSLMPQNNDPLCCLLLEKNCKTTEGTNNELKGFLMVVNQTDFRFTDISLLVFACCFFQEKKDLRLLASEVLINLVEIKSINIELFAEKIAMLISKKYGILLRLIEAITALKDISASHNSALFLLLDNIFKTIQTDDKLPTNFKKLIENYVDVMSKTNQKPCSQSLLFFEKYKDNAALKSLVKQILI